ncbi:hypothetical protein TNCV_20891 [Trichonephila clavipes]|uniref:Uncharacterized protein n=1 Tax=Trichonephila clavipes TaxID=2585209 RepID=A0A8X6UZE4_TRICX|nr:hypothetical protein TNCV_20891 [Trichonephila clavipes]
MWYVHRRLPSSAIEGHVKCDEARIPHVATRVLLNLRILLKGQVTRTTPEMVCISPSPNFNSSVTRERLRLNR